MPNTRISNAALLRPAAGVCYAFSAGHFINAKIQNMTILTIGTYIVNAHQPINPAFQTTSTKIRSGIKINSIKSNDQILIPPNPIS